MRDWQVSFVPARGGGPWNTYSCSACIPRFWSIFTRDQGLLPGTSSSQKNWVVRKVGGIGGASPVVYAGSEAWTARASSWILPRSTSIAKGTPTAPSADLSTMTFSLLYGCWLLTE